MPNHIEVIASILFLCAVLHTFAVKRFQYFAGMFPEGSVGENFFHLLGEVEIVFGVWAGILVLYIALISGGQQAISYVEGLNFTEPAFVFVIMAIAATKPIILLSRGLMSLVSHLLPLPQYLSFYVTTLIVGPILGSFITEPAAMTVTALILKEAYFDQKSSAHFKYATLAVLFVNVSIGGVLTHFAAPPVLMVAGKWGWDTSFMFTHFGWKAVIAILVNVGMVAGLLRQELKTLRAREEKEKSESLPFWLVFLHIVFLALVVLTSHHTIIFLGLFLFFLGVVIVTKEYQDELKLKESLLVSFFLGGLVVMGSLQAWWLKPLLSHLPAFSLFTGATFLTAIVDNAALTYLGTQVPSLSYELQYALVAGAVAGGGLTVIANAPNPAGFAILRSDFGPQGISPVTLFKYALLPTVNAMWWFWGL